jgi:hypothetical protein
VVIRLTLLVLLVTSFSSLGLTTLTATIDKNPVMVNESLVLTVMADAQVSPGGFDSRALLKDFVVGNTATSNQTQIVNGSITHQSQWTTLLISRKPGNYIIPAFTIEGIASQPISVKVIPASQQASSALKDVFVQTDVEQTTAYLQSTLQYTTKLYLAVDIQRGALTEPQMENANIRQLGKDEELSEIKEGKRYRVIKRIYLITPQRSGQYTIKSPVFTGELVMNKRRSFFSGFNNTKPVNLMGKDIEIEVKPIPDDYEGQWLPSELVALQEEWQTNDNGFTVGEPVTRTITLTAMGVSEEQLPEIIAQYPANIKTYPDQSNLNSATRQGKLIAQRKDSVAIVPGIAGQLTLPEVRVPWFNTRTHKIEFAVLPPKTITINAPEPGSNPQPLIEAPVSAQQIAAAPAQTIIKEVPTNSTLTWALLIAWLLTLLSWLLHARHLKGNKTPAKQPRKVIDASTRSHWNNLVSACKNNQAFEASNAMLQWGKSRWPQQSFTSAQEVALFLADEQLISALNMLQKDLYSNTGQSWQGNTLLTHLNANSTPKKAKKTTPLSPLHPA